MAATGHKPAMRTSRVNQEAVIRDTKIQKGSAGKRSRAGPKMVFNLKGVSEVLEEYGLNPTVKIVQALKSKRLDPKTSAAVSLALLEYIQPKLKSVEVKAKIAHDPAVLDAQITAMLEKMAKKA